VATSSVAPSLISLRPSLCRQIPKPGISKWESVKGSTGASAYGVVDDAPRKDFGGTDENPYASRSEFFSSFVIGLYIKGGDLPTVVCSLCHCETHAKAARLLHKDSMFSCCCEHNVHTSLNVCNECQRGERRLPNSNYDNSTKLSPARRAHEFDDQ
jgi:hypothetical protein